MGVREYIRFNDPRSFPFEIHPALSDYFLTLSQRLTDSPPSRRVSGIVGLYPHRNRARQIETVSFITFTTARTAYSALKDVEEVFADFYLQSGILPYINPVPNAHFRHPELMPSRIRSAFMKQGAYIYGIEE